MEQIEKTTDYNMFKTLDGNRRLVKSHVKKLTASIEKNNHLNLHPIVVNANNEVIDGQHRLECARNLGVDIYYVRSEKVSDDHLIDCNVNQRSFEVENFIDYFAVKLKNEEYIRLQKMMIKTGLKPKALLTLVVGTVSSNLLEFLKTGKFMLANSEDASRVLDAYADFMAYIKDKRIKPTSMFTNHNFTRAFRWLVKTNGFDPHIFFKKMDMRWFDLRPQRTSEEWYSLLIEVYNFKNHNKIEAFGGPT